MHEKIDHNALKGEIESGNFTRAALIAEQMGLPEEEIRDLRSKAIGQMTTTYRNAQGTRHLARQYGYTREDIKKISEDFADEMKRKGNTRPLGPRYDYDTGKYLSFEEWIAHYLKNWNRL